jgi:hypothetical protein
MQSPKEKELQRLYFKLNQPTTYKQLHDLYIRYLDCVGESKLNNLEPNELDFVYNDLIKIVPPKLADDADRVFEGFVDWIL